MLKAENNTQKKLKLFTLHLRVSSYCDHKRTRILTFASVHVYKINSN